ncbi:hypothetical protein NP493_243g01085 [Ridgeia piscesae]|uniref:Uncharacterized protein n=1 Tax=Ridgeia piscesae TaxID=27915 RepID=A0AAD9NZ79_RIDPI|nr:hypothetical protein NP493_243g01085 [Ridgeia piscesae]
MSLMWRQVRSRRYEKLDDVYRPDEDGGDVPASKSSRFSDAVLSLFLLVWFACGNFWTFAIWRPHFIQLLHEPSNWCDETVYMFTFVQILICYGIAAFVLMIAGILLLCHRCCLEKS